MVVTVRWELPLLGHPGTPPANHPANAAMPTPLTGATAFVQSARGSLVVRVVVHLLGVAISERE
jgi:hypothetical protein|eukprot:COSAG01_NODE_4371_length_5089_cov_51.610220_3_plen_64_part_00